MAEILQNFRENWWASLLCKQVKENSLTKQLSIPNILSNLKQQVLILQKTLQPGVSDSAKELLGAIGSLKGTFMPLTFTHELINRKDFEWKKYWVRQYWVTRNILKQKLMGAIIKDSFLRKIGRGEAKNAEVKKNVCCSLKFPDLQGERDCNPAP